MDWLNPVEWSAWLYGKVFQNHAIVGGVLVTGFCTIVGLLVWIRGVDKYREEHSPKQHAVTATNSTASQAVTDHSGSEQGVPANIPTPRDSTAKPRKAKNSANALPNTRPSGVPSVSTAGSQASHIHFNRVWTPNGIDLSDCNYCSVTGSQVGANNPKHAGVTIGNMGAVKVANNYIESGISAHGETQDAEIRRNAIGGSTAGFENAGKAERVLLSGNKLQPPVGGQAQIVKNDPGGEMKDVTALNNEIGTNGGQVNAAPQVSAPYGIAIGGGVVNNPTVNNNFGAAPPHLSSREEVIRALSEGGEKSMKVHITTDRSIPGAVIAIVFSGPAEADGEVTLQGTSHSNISPGFFTGKDSQRVPNTLAITINIPAAFLPGQELIVPVKSKVDAHVVSVEQFN